tara:strand:- start:48147 stop:48800 length:654 start_codon:yes stop_codon:yes gene_type:complete
MIHNINSGGFAPMMMQGMQNRQPPSAEQLSGDLLSAADTDSNGSISKTEFSAMFSSEDTSDSSAINGLFSEMDADGDEAVSVDKASNAISSFLQQLQEQRLANASVGSSNDAGSSTTDGDGGADGYGFKGVRDGDGGTDESTLAQIFADADTDGDGIITQDEIKSMLEKNQASQTQNSPEIVNTTTNTSSKMSILVNSLLEQQKNNYVNDESLSLTA